MSKRTINPIFTIKVEDICTLCFVYFLYFTEIYKIIKKKLLINIFFIEQSKVCLLNHCLHLAKSYNRFVIK